MGKNYYYSPGGELLTILAVMLLAGAANAMGSSQQHSMLSQSAMDNGVRDGRSNCNAVSPHSLQGRTL